MSSQQKVGFLRLPQVLELFPISKSAWWRGVKDGKYPRPVKLGKRCTAWRAAEIADLLERVANQNADIKPCVPARPRAARSVKSGGAHV